PGGRRPDLPATARSRSSRARTGGSAPPTKSSPPASRVIAARCEPAPRPPPTRAKTLGRRWVERGAPRPMHVERRRDEQGLGDRDAEPDVGGPVQVHQRPEDQGRERL